MPPRRVTPARIPPRRTVAQRLPTSHAMRNGLSSRVLLLLSLLPACSDSGEAAVLGRRFVDSSAGTVVLGIGERDYRPAALAASGTVAGAVTVQTAGPDSVAPVTRDASVCGDSARVTRSAAPGSTLGGVLVWVSGIGAGKPLPETRRDQFTLENCEFQPRVLAVISGTTINVMSRDRVTMTTRFYREGAGQPVEEIHTVDAGQVVPSEKIASTPGIVEARSVQHPWVRGYIAVFDHPYFAVTDADGVFAIERLPAGTYTMKVWHEKLDKPQEQRVVVVAGGRAQLDLELALR